MTTAFAGILAAALLATAAAQPSVFEEREFASPAQEARYQHLIAELRCLVCQNQSIGESNADLAAQLRDEVYAMLRRGARDQDIIEFMVSRYGDFVLFKPPVRGTTWLLWFGPFILLAFGLGFLMYRIRQRSADALDDVDLGAEEQPGTAEYLYEQDPQSRGAGDA